jgi:protein AaeX
MIGEVNLFGVFVPALLVLGIAALLVTGIVSRLLTLVSAYRLFAYRPLVDIAIFIFLLGGLVLLTASPDMTS